MTGCIGENIPSENEITQQLLTVRSALESRRTDQSTKAIAKQCLSEQASVLVDPGLFLKTKLHHFSEIKEEIARIHNACKDAFPEKQMECDQLKIVVEQEQIALQQIITKFWALKQRADQIAVLVHRNNTLSSEIINEIMMLSREVHVFDPVFPSTIILIDLLKFCALYDTERVAKHIQNFGIQDQQVRIDIAKHCAQKAGEETARCIQLFGIQDQSARIDIAKLCAQNDPAETVEHIQNFGIQDQSARIDIAKLCAQKAGGETARCIQHFGIQDQSARIDIAKLCAQNDSAQLAFFLRRFDIQDQNALIDILKICAERNAERNIVMTFSSFHNFIVHDTEENRERFVDALIQKGLGNLIVFYIDHFQLSERKRFEIAIQYYDRNLPSKVIDQTLSRLDLSEPHRFEIAKICAKQAPNGGQFVVFNIEQFHITSEEDRFELAKQCAQQGNGAGQIIVSIANFHFSTEQRILAIVKLCAQTTTGADLVCRCIRSFSFSSETDRMDIAMFCGRQLDGDINLFISYLKNNFDISDQKCKEILVELVKEKPSLAEAILKNGTIPFVVESIPPQIESMLQAFVTSMSERGPHVAQHARTWEQYTRLFLSRIPEIKHENMPMVLREIMSHRSPEQRFDLIRMLYTVCANGGFQPYLTMLGKPPIKIHHILPALFLTQLEMQGVTHVQEFIDNLPRYHDQAQNAPIFLETVSLLSKEQRLSPIDKEYILQLLIQNLIKKPPLPAKVIWTTLCLRCQAVRSLLNMGMVQKLDKTYIEAHAGDALEPLRDIIDHAIPELFPNVQDIEDFSGKFQRTFAAFRKPTLLLQYRTVLETLPEPDKTQCLRTLEVYIRSVLEGTFKTVRYDMSQNLHLQKVLSDPILAQNWIRGARYSIAEVLGREPSINYTGWVVEDSDNECDLLLSADEITGSCQSITAGHPRYSKALLGTLLNGEVRLLAVKNAQGEVVARSMLSLLWDSKNRCPVLLVEGIYHKGDITPEIRTALTLLAQQRARDLHLPLLKEERCRADQEELIPYEGIVEAFEGLAPYVYHDTAGGITTKGSFRLPERRLYAVSTSIEPRKD